MPQEYNCETSAKLDKLLSQFKQGLVTHEEVLFRTAEILADGIREEHRTRPAKEAQLEAFFLVHETMH